MNYRLHYDRLIDRARLRYIENNTYVEKHHIIPKCLGGSNKKENIVKLYAEEHFVAHQLLVRIYPGEQKLVYALHIMTVENLYQQRSKNKEYKWIRERYSAVCRNKRLTEEHKSKISEGLKGKRKGKSYEDQYGKERAEELRKLKSEQLTGRKIDSIITEKQIATKIKNGNHRHSQETRNKISKANTGHKFADERKENISKSLTGRKLSEEHKQRIRESKLKRK